MSTAARSHTRWNIAGGVVPSLTALLAFPVLIRALGAEKFGALSIIWIVIAVSSTLDLGIGRALTVLINSDKLSRNVDVGGLTAVGIALSILWAISAFLLLAIFYFSLSSWANLFDSKQIRPGVWLLAGLIGAIGIISTTLMGILEARDRFAAVNINKSLMGIASFLMPVIVVFALGVDLFYISAFILIGKVFGLIHLCFAIRKVISVKNILWRRSVEIIWSQVRWISLSTIVGAILVHADRWIVASLCGLQQLALYNIPQEIAQRMSIVPGAISSTYIPILARGAYEKNSSIYRAFKNQLMLFGFFALAFGLLGGPMFLSFWISSEFSTSSASILALLSIGVCLNGLALAPYTLLYAQARPRPVAFLHCIEVVPYIVLLYVLTREFGPVGAAVASSIRHAIDLLGLSSILRIYRR